MKKIKSPCINICTYSNGVCIGCFRSVEEILNWTRYTEREKSKVIENTINRRKEFGQNYYGGPI
jgi:uncharacterized protein